MFDGLKFKCDFIDLRQLETLPIEPEMCVGFMTGEMRRITGECDGIHFELSKSPETGKMFCRFRGSLHRYANGSAANVGAFTFDRVCGAVAGLCGRFGIDPAKAMLENLEIGLEVDLQSPANQFIKTLICHANKPFQPLNIRKPYLGRVCPRQEYDVKMYDKGKQQGQGAENLVRLEIHISKMAYLKTWGIGTLADLTHLDKVRPLGGLLQRVFEDVICYDGSVPETELSTREQMRLKDVCNPNWWAGLKKWERHKERQKFARWVEKKEANKLFLNVVENLPLHWENLLSVTRKNGDFLSGVLESVPRQNGDFLSGSLSGQKVTIDTLGGMFLFLPENQKTAVSTPPHPTPSTPSAKRSFFHKNFCRCCGRDISAQTPKSRYCSERRFGAAARHCRDKGYNQQRREAHRAEIERFEKLLPDLPAVVLSLAVFAPDRTPSNVATLSPVATLTHSEIFGKPYPGISQARRVDLFDTSGKCYTFTRSFAKRLLRFLASTPPTTTPTAKPLRPPPVLDRAPMPKRTGRIVVATLGEMEEKTFHN